MDGWISDHIPVGSFFTEKSMGTNALALSMNLKREVSILPQYHYCEYFQNYYEYCIPIANNGAEQGYLVLVSVKQLIKNEMIAVIKILMRLMCYSFINSDTETKTINADCKRLSCKQISVLKLVGKGFTDYAIAREMKINIGTVKYHKQNIFRNYNVGSSVEAVVMAIKHNHLSINEI